MIILWIYLLIAFTWACYNTYVTTPKYLERMPYKLNVISIIIIYIFSLIAGTILFPISFYQKKLRRKQSKWVILSTNIFTKTNVF